MLTPEPNLAPLPLDENSSRSVTLDGRSLILVNRAGQLFLYENNCPHTRESLDPLGGSLSAAAGDLIKCQRHGAEFLVQTGECVSGPCLGDVLTAVPFTQAGNEIYLD